MSVASRLLDPKDELAERLYSEFGFKPLDGQRMFLPMKVIPKWLGLAELEP